MANSGALFAVTDKKKKLSKMKNSAKQVPLLCIFI